MINKDWLKDVLAGRKQLLKKSEVQPIKVPFYDELSVKALWPQFKKDAEFLQYFPDKYPQDRGPPRDYFFNVLHTVHPEYLLKIMAHASKQRMTAEGDDGKRESIAISAFWEEELRAMPYLSRKYQHLSQRLVQMTREALISPSY